MDYTFELDDGLYAVHHAPVTSIKTCLSDAQICPPNSLFSLATVVTPTVKSFREEHLEGIASQYAESDDVWGPRFLDLIILRKFDELDVRFSSKRAVIGTRLSREVLPDGPYIVKTISGNLHPVYRLMSDSYSTFMCGCISARLKPRSFEPLITNCIAVPSRLYHSPTPEKPLAGLRFAVKDLIDVAGMKTGCGSKSFHALYPAKAASAPCVERLLDAGAILVGKTKSTQFADGQEPSEWFDYIAPFNPRGDGYQKPSSSSSGSAAAVAGFPWLDFALGTDTGGSIRHPAGVNGIFGTRPTLGAVESTGFCASPLLDTVGVLARSATILQLVSKIMTTEMMMNVVCPKTRMKYRLLLAAGREGDGGDSKWLPSSEGPEKAAEAETRFDSFVKTVEHHLGVNHEVFNIDNLWRQTRPAGQPESLDEATGTIYQIVAYYTYLKDIMEPFIADYKAANNGRLPFVDPIVRRRQQWARQVTPMQYEAATASLQMFARWVQDELFRTSDNQTIPIIMFPQTWGQPDYRDVHPDHNQDLFRSSFSSYSLSYCSGCPDFTIPIGELPYHSRITDRREWLPLSLSVLSKPGMDNILLGILKCLEEQGNLPPVTAGRRMHV